MTALWQRLTVQVPAPLLLAWALAAAFMAFVAWDQSHWWSTKDDYGFGWLVPIFVIFVVHDRWPRIVRLFTACAAPDSPRAGPVGKAVLTTLGTAVAAGGALSFLIGAFYRAGAGPSYPATLALSLGTAAIALALIFLQAPAPGSWTPPPAPPPPPPKEAKEGEPAPRPPRVDTSPVLTGLGTWDARLGLAAVFLFPALVWLVSAPMVSVIENQLSRFLLLQVTHVVFFIFEILGLPIEQQGSILVLPTGHVHVAEACSGIRSLTACLFAGSFLAAVFLDRLWKKVLLVGAAMLLAVFTNLLRSLFLTSWAYNYGPEAIEGTVHDVAGYAVLGLTVVGLLCLLPILNFFSAPPDEPGDPSGPTGSSPAAATSPGGAA